MGKHNAPNMGVPHMGWPAEPEADQTQLLTPVPAYIVESPAREPGQTVVLAAVPEQRRQRSNAPVRIAVMAAIVATIVLSGLVWAVNRGTDPQITTLQVSPPSLSAPTDGMLNDAVVPEGSSPTASPVVSASATGSPRTGASPTPIRKPSPTRTPTTVNAPAPPPLHTPQRPATTSPPPPSPPAPTAHLTAQFRRTGGGWQTYSGKYTITNQGTAAVKGWSLVVVFAGRGQITSQDTDVHATGTSNRVTFTNTSSNATLAAGGSVSFQFRVIGSLTPSSCTINGAAC
ncbi:hypothetical protein GCM10023322_22520 [Rugosimonospora acidiphila]|uniref:CBM2 domain-containing protein n=1 Tax=Rugosimonospora acidiphila TaxID=556531 RepID=A0ABP9RPE5_9ACTN